MVLYQQLKHVLLLAFDLDAVLGLVAVFVLVLGLAAVLGLAVVLGLVAVFVLAGVFDLGAFPVLGGTVLTGVFRVSSGENLIVCVLTLPVAGLPDILKYTHKKST